MPEFPTNLIFKDAGQLETLTEHRPVSLYVPSLIRRCSPLLFSFCLHNRVRQVRQPGCTLCLPLSPSNRSTLGVLATVSLNTVLLDSDRLLTHCFPLLRPCGNQVRRGLHNTIQERKRKKWIPLHTWTNIHTPWEHSIELSVFRSLNASPRHPKRWTMGASPLILNLHKLTSQIEDSPKGNAHFEK